MLQAPERSMMKSERTGAPKISGGAWAAIAVRFQLPFPVPI